MKTARLPWAMLASLVAVLLVIGGAAQPASVNTRVSPVTPTAQWSRAFSSNSTYTTALPAISAKSALAANLTTGPVTAASTGQLVIDRPGGNIIDLAFYGDDDNETVNIRVWAWDLFRVSATSYQWIPYCIWDGACTLSAAAGPTGGLVDDTMFFADTITTTSDRGLSPLGTRVMAASSADNGMAKLVVDPGTCTRIEVEMELGTADSFNCLYKVGG